MLCSTKKNWTSIYNELKEQSYYPPLKQFYSVGVPDPQTPIRNLEFVAMDFETTGLNPQQDAIISVGLIPFNCQRIFCRQAQYQLIKPHSPLKENSVVIHGITHNDVENEQYFSDYATPLLKSLQGKIVVAHFHPIERQFIQHAFNSYFSEKIYFPMIDTMYI